MKVLEIVLEKLVFWDVSHAEIKEDNRVAIVKKAFRVPGAIDRDSDMAERLTFMVDEVVKWVA